MKKITLALCACAFALTGLLASCSNGSKDYVNCNATYSSYKYAVTGTITTTRSAEYLYDSYFDLDADGKSYKESSTTTEKINGGFVTVNWTEDENRISNYTHYNIEGSATVVETTGSGEASYDGTALGSTKGSSTGNTGIDFDIYDIDGTYYINIDNEMVKLDDLAISEDDDAFEGSFGKEFSLNIKATNNNLRNISWDKDDETEKKASKSDTTTREVKLTFVPVEDFDPADYEDAE